MRLKLFNHNLNFRDSRHRRTLLKRMRITTTKGTNLMQTFVNKGDYQIPIGSRNCQSAWKRFRNVNIKTDSCKLTLLTEQVNSNHFTHMLKELSERLLIPKLPRETGNTHPLVNIVNSYRARVKERLPGIDNKIKLFDKPRTIIPNIVFVRNRSKFKKDPPITQINVLNRPLNMFPVNLCLGNNKG